MGASSYRRSVQVPESTWRKAKVIAASMGAPIHAVVTAAIEEYASTMAENIQDQMEGVKSDGIQGRTRSAQAIPG